MSGMKCFNCGKGVMYGHNVSHAKNRTLRLFKPNLHSARIVEDGRSSRVRLCTKCLRRYKKEAGVKSDLAATKITNPQPAVATAATV